MILTRNLLIILLFILLVITGGYLTFEYKWWSFQELSQYKIIIVALFAALLISGLRLNLILICTLAFSVFYSALVGVGPLTTCVFLWFSSYLFGSLIFRDSKVIEDKPLEVCAVGFSILGLLILVSSHFKVNYSFIYLAAISGINIFAFLRIQKMGVLLVRPSIFCSDRSYSIITAWIFVSIFIFIYMAVALPDFGHDALSVHLTVPRKITENHIWRYDFTEYVWSLSSLGAEMLYVPAYMLGGVDGVRVFNASFLLGAAALIYKYALQKNISRNTSLIIALIVLTTPMSLYLISSTFVEPCFLFFITATYVMIFQSQKKWIAIGMIFGYACTMRISGFVLAPTILLILIFDILSVKKWDAKNKKIYFIYFPLLFMIFSGINYFYAYISTGNPVFPLMNHIFRSEFFGQALNYNPTWIKNIGLYNFWVPVFDSKNFSDVAANGALGITFFVIIPLMLIIGLLHYKKLRIEIVVLMGTLFFIYIVFSRQSYLRYIYPAAGIILVILISCISKIHMNKLLINTVLTLFIFINLIRIPYAAAYIPLDNFKIYLDSGHRNDFFSTIRPYAVVGEILSRFPQIRGKTILLAGMGYDPVYYHYPDGALAYSWHSLKAFEIISQSNGDLGLAANKLGIDLIVCPKNQSLDDRYRFSDACHKVTNPFFEFGEVYVGFVKPEYKKRIN